MFELLLYAELSCSDASELIQKVQDNINVDNIIKVELVEVIQEASPKCLWDAND